MRLDLHKLIDRGTDGHSYDYLPMTTRIHRIFNLQWRLAALQTAVADLAQEIQRLVELEASQGTQQHSKPCIQGYATDKCKGYDFCSRCQAEDK